MNTEQTPYESYADVYWQKVTFNGVLLQSQNAPIQFETQMVLHTWQAQALPLNYHVMPFQERPVQNNLGAFSFFLGIAIIWSWFIQTNLKSVIGINKALFNYKAFVVQVHEDSRNNMGVLFGLLTTSLALLAYFGSECFGLFQWQKLQLFTSGSISAVLVFIGLIALIFARVLVLFLSSVVTNSPDIFNQYFALNVISVQFLGMLLFPTMVVYRFAPMFHAQHLLYFGIILVCIGFIYRIIRMLVMGLNTRSASFLHIILYICALEILPVALFIKWQLA